MIMVALLLIPALQCTNTFPIRILSAINFRHLVKCYEIFVKGLSYIYTQSVSIPLNFGGLNYFPIVMIADILLFRSKY